MILAADIGGTKSLVALYDGNGARARQRYENASFADFLALLDDFLGRQDACDKRLDAACIAVAGPVSDDGRTARLTNLDWPDIDADLLCRRYGIAGATVCNDFAAAALGAVTAGREHLATLQIGVPLTDKPRLVVGAGTGLGMAIALGDGTRLRVLPGEGGHTAFAPADAEQSALLDYLRQRHDRVTWERVVSGPGLAQIDAFLGGELRDGASVGQEALRDPHSRAGRAAALFCRCYGAYAGDMALATMARGGVYLAGGIAAKLLPLLKSGGFIAAFNDKAQHSDIAVRMPVYVVTDPEFGLHGAAALAQELLASRLSRRTV